MSKLGRGSVPSHQKRAYTGRYATLEREYAPTRQSISIVTATIRLLRKGKLSQYYNGQHAFLWDTLQAGKVLPECRMTCLQSLAWLQKRARQALLEE
jgi:hypothetical protein